ncbi:MAG: zinc ribbon protein [Betaproteobacteria bacterium]|nr:zinc ribbon protein [Betaproteobacteria bacterium]
MPLYDYDCKACGGFEAMHTLAQRDEPAACTRCGASSPRVLVAAPRLALVPETLRTAMETNERARHEPQKSGSYAKHPAGCGCCSSAKRTATMKDAQGNKAFPSRRPWMISH